MIAEYIYTMRCAIDHIAVTVYVETFISANYYSHSDSAFVAHLSFEHVQT